MVETVGKPWENRGTTVENYGNHGIKRWENDGKPTGTNLGVAGGNKTGAYHDTLLNELVAGNIYKKQYGGFHKWGYPKWMIYEGKSH